MNSDRANRRLEIGSTWISPGVAVDSGQHGGQISNAAACVRDLDVSARGIENRRAQ
jgi:hypothetical protein